MIVSSVITSLSTPRRPDSTVLVPTRVHVESPAVFSVTLFVMLASQMSQDKSSNLI